VSSVQVYYSDIFRPYRNTCREFPLTQVFRVQLIIIYVTSCSIGYIINISVTFLLTVCHVSIVGLGTHLELLFELVF
jgi:hypothetical protein